MKKSRTFTSRLTPENRSELAKIAREHFDGKLAPALDYLFDLYRGKPARPTLQSRVADTRQVELFAAKLSDFCERLDRVAARVAAPMPASADPALVTLVQGWRHDSARLRVEANELVSEAWLVRRALLGTMKHDIAAVKNAVTKWTAGCDRIRTKAEESRDAKEADDTAHLYRQYVPLWDLLYAVGLTDRTPPPVQPRLAVSKSSPIGELSAGDRTAGKR